jgi:hypothetical protein
MTNSGLTVLSPPDFVLTIANNKLENLREVVSWVLGILPLHANDPEIKAERERLKTIVDALMSYAHP